MAQPRRNSDSSPRSKLGRRNPRQRRQKLCCPFSHPAHPESVKNVADVTCRTPVNDVPRDG